jgi:hypothetical protein
MVGNVTLIALVLTEQAGSTMVTELAKVKLSTLMFVSNFQYPIKPAGSVLPLTIGPVLTNCKEELMLALYEPAANCQQG